MNLSDTIAAIATPTGRGAIGMIRLSGKKSHDILGRIFKSQTTSQMEPFKLTAGVIADGDEEIDHVLVSKMVAPLSYTGEHMVEINSHGSPYILSLLLQLLKKEGARQAEPGEFTFRAFLNGKMDLAQAESIEDVIGAESRVALKLAHHRRDGSLSKEIGSLRETLIEVTAHIEASIDFSTEEIDVFSDQELDLKTKNAQTKMESILNTYAQGILFSKGVSVAIVGRPNVGKSSLLNAILNYNRAIVTSEAGTTRDIIEATFVYKGCLFRVMDTAGIRHATNDIEAIGISRSFEKINEADIVLIVLDISAALTDEDQIILDRTLSKPAMLILNKNDLSEKIKISQLNEKFNHPTICKVSALNKTGIEDLKSCIYEKTIQQNINSDAIVLTKERHKVALEEALRHIQLFRGGLKEKKSQEFLALDLKAAIQGLGHIVGHIDSEDIYDKIFSSFCIGK